MNIHDLIHSRLREALSPDFLEVIDDSEKHLGHAGYQGGDSHFEVRISQETFADLSRVQIHQKIYALLADLLSTDVKQNKIHALKITLI